MPFSPIVVGSNTFNQSGDGRYMLSTITFGQPSNYFSVKGGSLSKDRSVITAAVTRVLQKDLTVGTVTTRKDCSVQLVIQIPSVGFTSTEVDTLANDISTWLTAAILDRVLNGES